MNPEPITTSAKASLRQNMRTSRENLSAPQRITFDTAIRQHLAQLLVSGNFSSAACYWPFNGEPDITPLCKQLMGDGMELALPVISSAQDNLMEFHQWKAETSLAENRFGIPEPQASITTPLAEFDVLFMPLVAYDHFGNRLGMGSGYYDRHLESIRHSQAPLRVGIAYSLQETEQIFTNSWDISLHAVVNERGCFTFSTN
jgi:5-formyltetrahydrofolate cyclo-ligase